MITLSQRIFGALPAMILCFISSGRLIFFLMSVRINGWNNIDICSSSRGSISISTSCMRTRINRSSSFGQHQRQ